MNFKKQISNYMDDDMIFRRQVIRNIPYFKEISDELTLEVMCLLRESIHD